MQVCQEVQNVWALSFLDRGINTRMAPAGDITLAESPCVKCGQCSAHCPTGAIVEKDETGLVWDALHNPDKICVVQIAPSVRVTVGEAFGLPPGTNLTKKLYSALRRLGSNQRVIVQVNLQKIFDGEQPDIFLKKDDLLNIGTDAIAPFLAVTRNAYRLSYGFGFVYDRNFYIQPQKFAN